MRTWAALALCSAFLGLSVRVLSDGLVGGPPPIQAPDASQGVSGAQMRQFQEFGTRLGESWLKDTFGLDLPDLSGDLQDSLQDSWDESGWGDLDTDGGGGQAAGLSHTASASSGKGLNMRVTQSQGAARLGDGLPFDVEVRDSFRLASSVPPVHAKINIPLSANDAWSAEARMPLDLSSAADAWWWRGLGLGKNLSLRSDMSSRLGFNQVEAGLGTDWHPGFWGIWDLNYAWQAHYGQGSGASMNWLKVSKRF